MSLPRNQREVGIVVAGMVDFAGELSNREHNPLKIGPGDLLKVLMERGFCHELLGANTKVTGPVASRFSTLLARAEGELSRRGIHAVSAAHGAEPGLDYRAEGIRPSYLSVWRDDKIVNTIVGAARRPAGATPQPVNRTPTQRPAPGERAPLSAKQSGMTARRARAGGA